MGWTDHTLACYAGVNTKGNKLCTRISCTLRFKTVWKIIQCCFTSKGYKGLGLADLRIFIHENILGGREIMRNLLYIRQGQRDNKTLYFYSIYLLMLTSEHNCW